MVTLTNGKVVANFSSPHPFTFEDGTILPACNDIQAELLKVTFIELVHANGDVELAFELSEVVKCAMDAWMILWKGGKVNVVLIPLPMMTALKEEGYNVKDSPFRCIRMEDRIKKLISISKQCI